MTEFSILNIKDLIKQNLLESAEILTEFLLTTDENNEELLILYGNILKKRKQYHKALKYYSKAYEKKEKKKKPKEKEKEEEEKIKGYELQFKIGKCNAKTGNISEAIQVIKEIPSNFRSVKMETFLGHLYLRQGSQRAAVSCFLTALSKKPEAIEVAVILLKLGFDGEKLASFYETQPIWLRQLINAKGYMLKGKNMLASTHFQNLEKTKFKGNKFLASDIGSMQANQKLIQQSLVTFKELISRDKFFIYNMDVYADLLSQTRNLNELNSLATTMLISTTNHPQPWIASSLVFYSLGEEKKVIECLDKAIEISPNYDFSYLIKSRVLFEIGRNEEAGKALVRAFLLYPRFEAYELFVKLYISSSRFVEAMAKAREANKKFPGIQSSILIGISLANFIDKKQQARALLNKVMEENSNCVDALITLAQLDNEENKFDEAIEKLESKVNVLSENPSLQTKLGECYMLKEDYKKSLSHFQIALRLNPLFAPARRGVERVDNQINDQEIDEDEDDEFGEMVGMMGDDQRDDDDDDSDEDDDN
eukprot:Anaeramoba_ignava/c20532_g2_i1.p1 GENE.c20532_g2_i1~~c20532_g2_i1.p1  ORF type:complete len:537 (+),score=141.26 c20532_g2_i1:17-1627(+)